MCVVVRCSCGRDVFRRGRHRTRGFPGLHGAHPQRQGLQIAAQTTYDSAVTFGFIVCCAAYIPFIVAYFLAWVSRFVRLPIADRVSLQLCEWLVWLISPFVKIQSLFTRISIKAGSRSLLVVWLNRLPVNYSQVFSGDKAKRLLGYRAPFSPEESVRRTVAYWTARTDI